MDDLISRKAAVEALAEHEKSNGHNYTLFVDIVSECAEIIRDLPSAQPERLTDDDFETIRIHLNAYKEKLCNQGRWKEAVKYQNIIDRFMAFASAQPEPQWIPVSERLPEYGVAVLTYDGHCFCVEKRIPTIRDDEGEPITGDWWVSDDYDEYDCDYYPNLRDGACIAWMPLPEPYRAERRTDETD